MGQDQDSTTDTDTEVDIIQLFITTVNPALNIKSKNIFGQLVGAQVAVRDVLGLVNAHPSLLTMKIRSHYVFDYFYDKVIADLSHPVDSVGWQDALVHVLQLLESLPNANIIKENKQYLLRLQSSARPLTEIFCCLVDYEFEMGDAEFVTYSVIARGELDKLDILYKRYVIEGYTAIFSVALRYGRSNIIAYLIDALDNLEAYGNIIDLAGFEENPRYMYYREHIAKECPMPELNITTSDYKASIEMIMSRGSYQIKVGTIRRWCDTCSRSGGGQVAIPLLLQYLSEPVPLTTDFGEFNQLIFGHEWSDRKCLVERCLSLEQALAESRDRYDIIESQYRHLQSRLF